MKAISAKTVRETNDKSFRSGGKPIRSGEKPTRSNGKPARTGGEPACSGGRPSSSARRESAGSTRLPPIEERVDREFKAWLEKYTPVERAIIEAREKREENVRRRRENLARWFGGLCELTDGDAWRWRNSGFFEGEELVYMLFQDPDYYSYLDYVRATATKRIDRLRKKVRRPVYYAAESARRRALAAERRKIRERRTTNPCPTREQILDAWTKRRESHEAAIRFGSLIEDLECYVDNSLIRNENGAIVARRSGIKGWLQENIPALSLVYTTVMRYKAAAKKLKQITELGDPTPADAVLCRGNIDKAAGADAKRDCGADEIKNAVDGAEKKSASGRIMAENGEIAEAGREITTADGKITANGAKIAVPEVEIVRARAIWEEIVKDIRGSATALIERLDALTDPERVEDANMLVAWREKYRNEITVRTKKRWWLKRLWKRAG